MEKFSLTSKHKDVIKWYGVSVELNLSFDNVLLLFNLLKDNDLEFATRLSILTEMLIVNKELFAQLDYEKRVEFALDTLRDIFHIDLRNPPEIDENALPQVPIYDWEEDAERIYASFLMDYNMDLFEQQGRLQWTKFLALFKNLSDETPIGQAMHYRTCSVPKASESTEEERRRIRKMKRKYELQAAKPILDKIKQMQYEKSMKHMKDRQLNK